MSIARNTPFALLVLLAGGACGALAAARNPAREVIPMDSNWRFRQGEVVGGSETQLDDSDWARITVPHDWSIAGPFAKTNQTGGAGAWAPSGVGWYRQAFTLPQTAKGKRVYVEFDGIMENSEVWLNGVSLGKRPNGYVTFGYDLTSNIHLGESNTNYLAVRADTSAQPASRWYSGAGIYRHVRIMITDPVHLEPHSTFITTPQIEDSQALVQLSTSVRNDSRTPRQITIQASVHGPPGSAPDGAYAVAGASKPVTVAAGQSVNVEFEVKIPWRPRLWSVGKPDLHTAVVRLQSDGTVLDDERITFGIRDFAFKADSGFWLNGKNFKLYGVCLHHDGSAFGAAVPLAVWHRRLENLRALGVNAVRTAHNPPAPDFLDLCDRMGFLVMEEFFDCWTLGKNRHDYHLYFDDWSSRDLADTVRRDRNHPSVVLWSIGNEIRDTPKPGIAIPIARRLVEECHRNDPTRPVTQALFRPNVSGDYTNGLADLLDVVGTNYRDNELLQAQREKPARRIIGTEQRHDRQTWLWLRDNPTHSGQFLWVGVDYLGETRSWPRIAYPGGLLDRTAMIKPMAYERQSWWSDTPMVRLVRRVAPNDVLPEDPGYGGEERHTQVQYADWTPKSLAPHQEKVEVYSNCEEVELFLNGVSLGKRNLNPDASPRVWQVPFEPGKLQAVARNNLQVVAEDELRTAGKPARIELSVWGAPLGNAWDDVAFVTAEIVDEAGTVVPRADARITFAARGPARIVAVDSGDNASVAPFQSDRRNAFQGRCEAAIKSSGSTGKVVVTATAEGLSSGKLTFETK